MAAIRSFMHDIICAVKHVFHIYDYQLVLANPYTGYRYFLYTNEANGLNHLVSICNSKSMVELKLKCAIAGIDFDKVDLWDLKHSLYLDYQLMDTVDAQLKQELCIESF